MGENRDISRHVQTHQPRSLVGTGFCVTGIPCCGRQGLQCSLRQTLHLLGICELEAPLLGGIKNVIAKAGGEGGETFAGLVEGDLMLAIETDTPLLHRQQFGVEYSLAGGAEGLARLVLQAAENLMQHLALTQAVAKADDLGLLGRVGFAQLRRIADAIEVGDHTPTPAETLSDALHRLHHLLPTDGGATIQSGLKCRLQFCELLFKLRQQDWDVLPDQIRCDLLETGKAVPLKQG